MNPGRRRVTAFRDPSAFPPYTCYYSGMRRGDGDRVTVVCPFIKTGSEDRESETAMETERPRDDRYQQELSMNHNCSRDPKYTILNTQRRETDTKTGVWLEVEGNEKAMRWKKHGYPAESLLDLRLIGTNQCRQPSTRPPSKFIDRVGFSFHAWNRRLL